MLKLRIGTRGSRLALIQAQIIADGILRAYPDAQISVVKITTTGDKNLAPFSSDPQGIKGMFTLELERALMKGEIDFAVHSLKDLPAKIKPELPIVAYSRRADPRDVLVARGEGLGVRGEGLGVRDEGLGVRGEGLGVRDEGLGVRDEPRVIGSSSLRRKLQLMRLFPESEIIPVRGNIDTRLRKIDSGEISGLVLAAAGIERLGQAHRITRIFSVDEVVPAPGQGILACQGRMGEDYGYLSCVNDEEAELCALAERSFARILGAGCNVPVGAYAEIGGDTLRLRGLFVNEDGKFLHGEVSEIRDEGLGMREKADELGRKLAEVIML